MRSIKLSAVLGMYLVLTSAAQAATVGTLTGAEVPGNYSDVITVTISAH